MKTLALPQWKLIPHSSFKKLSGDLAVIFSECHIRAQVLWDRNGPCVAFETEEDLHTVEDRLNLLDSNG